MTDDERWEYDILELMQREGLTRAKAEEKLQKRAQAWLDAKTLASLRAQEPTKQ